MMKHIYTKLTFLLLLLLGSTSLFGSSTYYSKVTVAKTGSGTVYVKAGSTFSGTKTSDTQNSDATSAPTHTYSIKATAADGYEFAGWSGSGVTIANASAAQTTCTITANSTNKNSPASGTATATFKAIPTFYFKSVATTNNSTYGSAYTTFTASAASTTTSTSVTADVRGEHYNTASATKTAYFRAVANSGYVFKGWSTTSSEDDIFDINTSITYNLTSDKTSSSSPATIQYYAIFGTKFAPQITGTATTSTEVGDSYTADFTFKNTSSDKPTASNSDDFYFTINHQLSSSVHNGTNVISYDPTKNEVKALNAGTATITFTHKSTDSHEGASETFTIKVSKKTATLKVNNGTNFTQTMNLDATLSGVTFTSTNTDYTNSPIAVAQKTGNNVAAMEYTQGTRTGVVKSSYTIGNATWEITQSENYQYKKATATYTVNVELATSDCSILLHSSNPDKEASNVGTIDFGYYGASMTFDVKAKGLGGTTIVTKYYSDNNTSNESASGTVDIWGSSYESKNMTLGANNSGAYVTKVKFAKSGTDDPYINTIRIYAAKYLETKNTDGAVVSKLTTPLNVKGGHTKKLKFKVEYATCASTIKLVSSSDKLKFANGKTTYSFTPDSKKYGRKEIELTFTSANAPETVDETITIYTQYEYKTLTVTCKTVDKLTTTLRYKGENFYSTNQANLAATEVFEVVDQNGDLVTNPVITLKSSNTNAIGLESNNTVLNPGCGGSSTITASYAGDDIYKSATDLPKTITINHEAQDVVDFTEVALPAILIDDEIDLTGWATSACGADITYEVVTSNELTGSIKVENGKVKGVSKGTVRLRAYTNGDCTNSPSEKAFHNFVVRDINDPCGTILRTINSTVSLSDGNSDIYPISDGLQDQLTLKVWKQSNSLFTSTSGTAIILFLNANNQEITRETYSVDNLSTSEPSTANITIDLKQDKYAGTKKLQFSATGNRKKYFKEIRVTQQAYLNCPETVPMSTVQACQESSCDFTVSYSDLARLQLSQTNPKFTYEIWKGNQKLDVFDNDCGGYGEYTLKFYYTPKAKGDFSNTVTISASGLSKQITLSGTAQKPDREIVWNPDEDLEIYATQSLTFDASAKTDCLDPAGTVEYSYEAAKLNAATVNGNQITFNKAGDIIVKVNTVDSENFYNAPEVTKTWTVKQVEVEVTNLNITSTIKYGDDKSVVAYDNSWQATGVQNGQTVTGTPTYVAPEKFDAVGQQDLTFKFIADDEDVYVKETTFTVQVNVLPAVATYAATATIILGQPLSAANLKNATTGINGESVSGTITWANSVDQTTVPTEAGTYTYAIHFESTNNNYESGDGMCTVTVLEGKIFTGAADDNDVWLNPTNWEGGVPSTTDRVIIDNNITISGNIEVGGLTINAGKTVTVADGATLTVGDKSTIARENNSYGNIIVEAGGQLKLHADGDVQINDFTLYSSYDEGQPKSGQVSNPAKLHTNGNAYFILDLDPSGNASYGWYDFTVPFPVDVLSGVARSADGSNWDTTIKNEVNYAVMAFYEDLRAQNQYAWKKYHGILQPGRAYTMTIDSKINTYRFAMTKDGEFNTTLTQALEESGDGDDYGWNGVGNGTMQYIKLNEQPTVQMYQHTDNVYLPVDAGTQAFAVGSSYFVQKSEQLSQLTLVPVQDAISVLRAPQREREAQERFGVTLTQDGKTCDNLFVTCSDEATTAYTRGKDVQKMGNLEGAKIARMWTNAKGKNLCAIYTAYNGNEAVIPMQIYAPATGSYTLALSSIPAEDVYLTRNGIIVWDLTMSEYTFDIEAGTNDSYALQVVRRAPSTATGVDATDNRGTIFAEKMIVNGQLYILRDGVLYDAQGKKVADKY